MSSGSSAAPASWSPAPRVMRHRRAGGGHIFVQKVRRIGVGEVRRMRPVIGGVGRRLRRDLRRRVIGERVGKVVRRPRRILRQRRQSRRVEAVARDIAVAARQARPPPEIVSGEGRQNPDPRGRAVLADRRRRAGEIIVVIDIIAAGIGQPRAPPRRVIFSVGVAGILAGEVASVTVRRSMKRLRSSIILPLSLPKVW